MMRRLARLPGLPPMGFGRAPLRRMPGLAARRRPQTGWRLGAGFAVGCLSLYAVSPYVALWRIASAVRAHDAAGLSRHIDWSALDTSLKTDAVEAVAGSAAPVDDLPDFGSSFASTAVSHAIDTEMNAQTLIDMATPMMPQAAARPSLHDLRQIGARFVAPSRFEARLPAGVGQTPVVVHLRFEHWRWQITRFELPQIAHVESIAEAH